MTIDDGDPNDTLRKVVDTCTATRRDAERLADVVDRQAGEIERLRRNINRAGALASQKASHQMIIDALSAE